MTEIKRYEFELHHCNGADMSPCPKGGYVGYDDHAAIVAALREQVRALAAENAQMLRLLTDISSHHVEYFSEGEDGMFAGVPLDYVSEINMYVSRDVNAENPFGATDAAIRELQAQELDCAADELMLADTVASTGVVAHLLRQRAARLRTGEVINA